MFEAAELGHRIDKSTYDSTVPKLREALLEAQYKMLQSRDFSLVIVVGGVDGAGKGEVINLLNAWMDPRYIHVHATGDPTEEERLHPTLWRFWRVLPPRGETAVLVGGWYSNPILRRGYRKMDDAELDQRMQECARLEKMLSDEHTLVLKFWLHLSKQDQQVRFEKLEKKESTRWRVTETDWANHKRYAKLRKAAERALRLTNTAVAPWVIVEGKDARYRNLSVAQAILDAMHKRLAAGAVGGRRVYTPTPTPSMDHVSVLSVLDLSSTLSPHAYERALAKYQGRLNRLTRDARFGKYGLVLALEGADAAGKGGAIRRVTGALDARQYHIMPVGVPTDEELAHPYLWRFWRQIPVLGKVAIFDRSWYGRVLVERVEGYASQAEWMRAYGEINDFEEQLASHGIVLVKCWLEISKEEQKRRFEARRDIAYKQHKLTAQDWRNRKKWDAYQTAVCDMVERTSTATAPWTLVEAEDKLYARIKVLKTLCQALENRFDGDS